VRIYISDSAYRDLHDIKQYYEAQAVPLVGMRLVESLIEHIQTLADNPDIGRVVPEFGEKQIRELIHPPFRIVYVRELASVHVIRVWRSERLLKLPET